jgi:hypothetical protein
VPIVYYETDGLTNEFVISEDNKYVFIANERKGLTVLNLEGILNANF